MTVSVIVPLYNKAPYVRRALDSIRAQSWTDYEVIVVDDGSTDGGGSIVSELRDPRFRLIVQPNAGPGPARNRGLAEASRPFVAFLDADDEWLPEFLAASLERLERAGPAVAAVASGYFEFPSGLSTEPLWRRRGLADGVVRVGPETAPRRLVFLLAFLSPFSVLARAATVRRWGGFYDRGRCLYAEDANLWLKVLLNEPVAYSMRPLVRYHREASVLSRQRGGPRPVEPFLADPSEIEGCCPVGLRPLLADFLALRALKTAGMLASWGRTREARALIRRYARTTSRREPLYWAARLAASPVGPPIGRAWRAVRKSMNTSKLPEK